jgi:hypothetical protein
VVSNKVLGEFRAHPNTHKIIVRACKSRNFIKSHFLQVVGLWVAEVASAKAVAAVGSAKVVAVAGSVKAVAAVASAKVAAAVDLVKVAAAVVLVAVVAVAWVWVAKQSVWTILFMLWLCKVLCLE